MTVFTGTITAEGLAVEGRTVRALVRSTGITIAEITTDAAGNYTLDTLSVPDNDVILVALPNETPGATPSYNAQILDQF